jgi:nucleotide-binding universal stress UspA family protein
MRLLYATDGSRGAVAAADLLRRLALGPGDHITLLAVDPLSGGAESSERFFGEPRRRLEGLSAQIDTEVLAGSPAEQILEYSASRPFDLVVLGAMGSTGLARFLMGSVAEKVVRHAEVMTLIARHPKHELRRVVVGVDASSVSERLAAAAAAFPLPPESEIRLLTVLPPRETVASLAPMIWTSLSSEMDEILKAAVVEAEERLRDLARVVHEHRPHVSAAVLRGDPATSLLAAIEQEEADMVVVGSRGEGGVDRFLLGSVSERIARYAPCSVLVVR